MGETKTNTFWRSIVSARYSRLVGFVATMCLFVIFGFVLVPVCDKPEDTFAAPTPSTTTLAMTTPSVSLSLALDDAAGTFAVSDPASFSVTTNNYTGYALSIRAKEDNANNSKLINGSHVLNSISAATADGTGFSVGDWGYKPSKLNSVDNTNFLPAPTYAGSVLNATTTANSTADNYSLALAAKADLYTISGTYSNTFVLAAVPNAVNYTITYDKNTTDTVSNMPTTQTGTLGASDITLSSNTPSRTGYGFFGWCGDTITTTNGIDSCNTTTYAVGAVYPTSMQTENSITLKAMWRREFTINFNANGGTGTMAAQTIYGNSATLNSNTFSRSSYAFSKWNTASGGTGTSYNNGATFTVPATGTSTTLYAIWGPMTFDIAFANAGKSKSGNYYKMQDMTTTICSAITTGQTGSLIDTRDSTVYNVGKLADNKCWLLDNLALDLVAKKSVLSSANTNATDAQLGYLKNGGGTTSNQYATAAIANWTSSDSFSAPLQNTASKTVLPTTYNGKDDPMRAQVTAGQWKVGVYYNYCAASAGTYCYGNGMSAGSASGNATADICPSGWRMPTGGASGEYQALAKVINGATGNITDSTKCTNFRNVLRLPLSGDIWNRSVNYQGSSGSFWSSTYYNSVNMYYLSVGASGIYPQPYRNRYFGFSVRCIAK